MANSINVNVRPGRNDRCWCGSGKKFKRCHLGRDASRPVAPEALMHRVRQAAQRRLCMHPESPQTCDRVAAAHTVQRSRVLRAVVDSGNKLMTFHQAYRRSPLHRGPYTVGWQQASTITAFCSRHDSSTFKPLEGVPFEGTAEQCFLHAYRALCMELYVKKGGDGAMQTMRDQLDRGLPEAAQRDIQQRLEVQRRGSTRGAHDLSALKRRLDQALLGNTPVDMRHAIIDIGGPVDVVTTGAFAPDLSPRCERIQDLTNPEERIQVLTVASDIVEGGCALVFSWLAGDPAPEHFVAELVELHGPRMMAFLPQLLFIHLGNTYFSREWWSDHSHATQDIISRQALNPNPYASKGELIDSAVTSWTLRGVRQI